MTLSYSNKNTQWTLLSKVKDLAASQKNLIFSEIDIFKFQKSLFKNVKQRGLPKKTKYIY